MIICAGYLINDILVSLLSIKNDNPVKGTETYKGGMEHPTHSMIKNDNPVKGTETGIFVLHHQISTPNRLRIITSLKGKE